MSRHRKLHSMLHAAWPADSTAGTTTIIEQENKDFVFELGANCARGGGRERVSHTITTSLLAISSLGSGLLALISQAGPIISERNLQRAKLVQLTLTPASFSYPCARTFSMWSIAWSRCVPKSWPPARRIAQRTMASWRRCCCCKRTGTGKSRDRKRERERQLVCFSYGFGKQLVKLHSCGLTCVH